MSSIHATKHQVIEIKHTLNSVPGKNYERRLISGMPSYREHLYRICGGRYKTMSVGIADSAILQLKVKVSRPQQNRHLDYLRLTDSFPPPALKNNAVFLSIQCGMIS